jgi:hypothetical protein
VPEQSHCTSCGEALDKVEGYCPSCGNQLSDVNSEKEEDVETPPGLNGVIGIGLFVGGALGLFFGGNIVENMLFSGAGVGETTSTGFIVQAGFFFGTPIVFGAIYTAIYQATND